MCVCVCVCEYIIKNTLFNLKECTLGAQGFEVNGVRAGHRLKVGHLLCSLWSADRGCGVSKDGAV